MTIEIHHPELEALLLQRMESGMTIEDLLLQGLQVTTSKPCIAAPAQSLDDLFARVRGMADDLDLTRNPSTGRPATL